MSLAGLEEGVAQTMHVMCSGGGTFFGHYFACDRHHRHGRHRPRDPLVLRYLYYTLAEKLGIDTIARYATSLGLAQRTGIDLPDEVRRHHALQPSGNSRPSTRSGMPAR